MKPSRELDALVAEKVMGISKEQINEWLKRHGEYSYSFNEVHKFPYYSTDIASAWEVVEKLELFKRKQPFDGGEYHQYCQLWQDDDEKGKWTIGDFESQLFILAEGETAPHAICLAALKAVGTRM